MAAERCRSSNESHFRLGRRQCGTLLLLGLAFLVLSTACTSGGSHRAAPNRLPPTVPVQNGTGLVRRGLPEAPATTIISSPAGWRIVAAVGHDPIPPPLEHPRPDQLCFGIIAGNSASSRCQNPLRASRFALGSSGGRDGPTVIYGVTTPDVKSVTFTRGSQQVTTETITSPSFPGIAFYAVQPPWASGTGHGRAYDANGKLLYQS